MKAGKVRIPDGVTILTYKVIVNRFVFAGSVFERHSFRVGPHKLDGSVFSDLKRKVNQMPMIILF